MDTILLKDNEKFYDKTYINCAFDTLINVVGDDCVLENVLIASPKKDFKCFIKVSGKNCRIKNCRFESLSVKGTVIMANESCIIENCLFLNGLTTREETGSEAIKVNKNECVIINNRFENWDRTINIVSMKSDNNIFVNNHIINCAGTVSISGQNNLVAFNKIDGKLKHESGGFKVNGNGHYVKCNLIKDCRGNDIRASIHLNNATDCILHHNIMVNCEEGFSLLPNLMPINTTFVHNTMCKVKYPLASDIECEIPFSIGKKYNDNLPKFNVKKFSVMWDEIKNALMEVHESDYESEDEEMVQVAIDTQLEDRLLKKLLISQKLEKMIEIQKSIKKTLDDFQKLNIELKKVIDS